LRKNKLKKKLRGRKVITLLLLIVALGANGYFFYQLSPSLSIFGIDLFNFDNNLLASANQTNSNLSAVQTNINKYRFLSGELYLNQFSFDMVRFFDGVGQLSDPATIDARGAIENQLTTLKNEAPKLLASAKTNLTQNITTPLIDVPQNQNDVNLDPQLQFQKDLRRAISQEKGQLLIASQNSGMTESLQREINFLNNTNALVGNRKVINALNAISPDNLIKNMNDYQNSTDPAQKQQFKTQIMNIIGSTKNPLATISNLKSTKINWTNKISAIDLIAKKVNAEHNSGTNSNSSITFSSFDLNGTDKKVSFSGLNKTNDGTNREVVTFLIEALEASPQFKNVNNRTFPLSKDMNPVTGKKIYSMNFRIDMELESNGFDTNNTPLISFVQNIINKVKSNK